MSATAASPEEATAMAAAAASLVDNVLLPELVGTFISCALLGIFLSLVARYFSNFAHDRQAFKALVCTLTALALVDTCNQCAMVYYYAIENFANPAQLATWPATASVFCFCTGTSIYICHLFFIWRGWVVGGGTAINNALTAFLLVLATAGVVCVYIPSVKSTGWTYITEFEPVLKYIWAWIALGFAVDFLITGSLLWHLVFQPRKQMGKNVGHSPLTRIAILSVKTNALALLVQIPSLVIIIVMSSTMWYSVVTFADVKTYSICVVATLNARTGGASGTSLTGGNDPSSSLRPKGLGAFDRSQGLGQGQVNVHTTIQHDVERESGLGYEPGVPSNPYTVFVLDEAAREGSELGEGKKGMRTTDSF